MWEKGWPAEEEGAWAHSAECLECRQKGTQRDLPSVISVTCYDLKPELPPLKVIPDTAEPPASLSKETVAANKRWPGSSNHEDCFVGGTDSISIGPFFFKLKNL